MTERMTHEQAITYIRAQLEARNWPVAFRRRYIDELTFSADPQVAARERAQRMIDWAADDMLPEVMAKVQQGTFSLDLIRWVLQDTVGEEQGDPGDHQPGDESDPEG